MLVEERYRVRQEISRNPDIELVDGASGSIDVEVPYDGYEHVTRTTVDDVRRWIAHHRLPSRPTDGRSARSIPDTTALIGHLVLTDHQDTDLAIATGITGRTIAMPLRIPVRSTELRSDEVLVADSHTFRQTVGYRPGHAIPALIPVEIDVEVTDPGSVPVLRRSEQNEDNRNAATDRSQKYMAFEPYLVLDVRVVIHLPPRKGPRPPAPIVRRVRVSLPSGLTLAPSAIRLVVREREPDEVPPDGPAVPVDAEPVEDDMPEPVVLHNPGDASIEWTDVKMRLDKHQPDQPITFCSPLMRVHIHQPGELFNEPELVVRADVEAPDILLSGAKVRLFDARGMPVARRRREPLVVRTSVTAEATVVLDEAFAKRLFTPFQTFHFDEVIPDSQRVEDIRAALADLRYKTLHVDEWPMPKVSRSHTLVAWIVARRGDEEDAILLQVFVFGRRHRTRRQSQHRGGRRFTSKLDTGDLTVVFHGEVLRESGPLIRDVNALQLVLRDQFHRMKAQR
ncbi:MAG: hypothetical protein AB7J32_25490 [Pseudonocardia sp.]